MKLFTAVQQRVAKKLAVDFTLQLLSVFLVPGCSAAI
jgi:hypothetical protein